MADDVSDSAAASAAPPSTLRRFIVEIIEERVSEVYVDAIDERDARLVVEAAIRDGDCDAILRDADAGRITTGSIDLMGPEHEYANGEADFVSGEDY